jgi:adenylylsulfate kinase-like enzyme
VDQVVDVSPQALLVTGTVGSGKTSVADAVGDLLADAHIPNAVIDLDWLRRSWPRPPDDPFNVNMILRNLRPVARNYLDAGAVRLVLAGVVESLEERQLYHDAVGVDLVVCRLRVDLPTVRQRLAERHDVDAARLRWHLDRSGELDSILDRAGVQDLTVDAASGSVTEIAAAVVSAVGWV